MARRSGSPISLWNNVAVGVGGTSTPVEVARDTDQLALFITVSAGTTITLECAHSGAIDSEGEFPDANVGNWGALYYTNTAMQLVLAGAGSVSWIIPDFEPGWIRLKSSAAATITAGHEVTSG